MMAPRLALIAFVLIVFGLLRPDPADAEQRTRCLSRDQQRTAIAERRAVSLATVRRVVRARVPGELVRAQLCQEAQRLVYMLTVLPRDGKVRRVLVDARNGVVLSVR
jgi:uncharacterized membrane protein YkoI